ncbi:hypothetical protein PHET_04415 [Paragonimus heterotremus]|uniref:RING-type domain-containing protein n=1 Tax=Paragonimus heterotremus TaxID=100268 RepID=A0A8J4T156_9TREM|nr:hypothetical protein PHET_04415 [Paragonimus heterotremus]
MRGRASEGLDLADYAGRGVAILGLPYPPFQDPRVKLKMAYLDEQKVELSNQASCAIKHNSDHKVIATNHPTGRKWYNQQAWRAVNQSIGRVIRHHRDFGAIFLCDERFAPVAARSQLPHWMQSSIRIYSEWNSFLMETSTFFKNAMKQYPPIATTLIGQSTQSSFVKHSAYKPLKSQFNTPSFGFNHQKLSNLPCASETVTFSHSLAQHHPTPDGDSLLANYMKPETSSHLSLSVLKSSSSSIFDSIDNQSDESAISSTVSLSTTGESKEDDLEAKLLQCRPSKRIRLCRAIENLPTDNTSCLDPATYLAAVKSTFICSPGTGTNRDFMRDFKEALKTYKETTTSNTVDHLNNDNMECVRVLHNKLATIFASDESKKLLTGVICFLLPAHRSYYAELCKQRTLLTADQPNCSFSLSFSSDKDVAGKSSDNTVIKCSKCHGCPARTPLVSTCNHIACFGCWRTIIEDGNRRCPSCHCLVRRRNLTRLVVQPANASKLADA